MREQVIRDYDPNIAIHNVRTLKDAVSEELGPFRVMAILVVAFGVLALLLSAVGLYGVQSFLVARRTREIGIRMALGATAVQVAGATMGRGSGAEERGSSTRHTARPRSSRTSGMPRHSPPAFAMAAKSNM